MEGLLTQFTGQVDVLKRSMVLREASLDKKTHVKALAALAQELAKLEIAIASAREYVDTEEKSVAEAEGLVEALAAQDKRTEGIRHNLPKCMPTAETAVPTQDAAKDNVPERPKTAKKGTKKSGKAAKAKIQVSQMKYVKVDEFESTPKYIRGRASRDQCNAVIDTIFATMKEKYRILGVTRSKLSDRDLHRWTVFKEQETKETDNGVQFITEHDIKELTAAGKVDNTTRTCFTVLRHLGRLKELRGGGVTRYITL